MTDISTEKLALAGNLRQHLTVQRWLRDKAGSTQTNYLANMIHFQEGSGMNPDRFLEWAKTVDPVEVQDRIDGLAEGLHSATAFNFKIDMRSFLRHNGYNNLPKAKLTYTLQDWHRGYRKDEVRKLLSFLDSLLHKLYVYVAAETGLRANTVLAIHYKHIAEDFEAGVTPIAIRFEPNFYGRKKSAGYTFLGERSVAILREGVKAGLIGTKPDSPVVPIGYAGMYDALVRARAKARLDPKIQPNHGLRKYFEDALDAARIDKDKKMMIEGHFAGTRAKHYTDREWDELRKLYREAYPHIDVDATNPELEKKLLSWEDEKLTYERELDSLRKVRDQVPDLLRELGDMKKRLEQLEKKK